MTYQLTIFPQVVNDLEDAFYWYEEQSEGLGQEMEAEFYSTLEYIQGAPLTIQIRYLFVRIAWLNRFPYGVHFYCEGNCIFVTALIHTGRDPKVWTERLKP
jgi:hypothetical protein